MNVKVLENDLQKHLTGGLFKYKIEKMGSEYDPDNDNLLDSIIGHDTPRIEPVFNRVGFYLLDNKTAWYEFQLPSGRFVGIKYGKDWFDYQMDIHNADENPVGEKEWVMVQHLIKKGVIPRDKRWRDEHYRRERRLNEIEMNRWMKDFRVRVKNRIEEKKREKAANQ